MKQKTIAKPFVLSGLGIHSGEKSSLSVFPAPPNSGLYFVKEGEKGPALVDQVKETKRGTTLADIAVTEHLLAAVFALGIDNLEIKVVGPELPIMDGSSLPFVKALESAGIAEQTAEKSPLTNQQTIKLADKGAFLEALPYNGFKVDFMVDFPGIGEQRYSFELKNEAFKKEIAPARTFGYIEEYELLKEQGLARGASFDNSLVLGKDGYINSPRFPDELVRHKILDLMGDLALLGQPLKAWIKANKSGHKLNIELARRLMQK